MADFIEVLKQRTDFSVSKIEKMLRFNDFLYEKNEQINLTRIKKEDSVYRNFLDSLNSVALKELSAANKIIDIGSGSGFPAVAMAIAHPEKKFTLVEATGKKVAFLIEATELLDLTNVEVVSARAEELAHNELYREKYDAATARAVATAKIICELSAGFVKPEGKIVLYKGVKAQDEIAEAKSALSMLKLDCLTVAKYTIGSEDDETYMVVLKKNKKLNKSYPRPYAKIKKS